MILFGFFIGSVVGLILLPFLCSASDKIIDFLEKRKRKKREEEWIKYKRSQLNQTIYNLGELIRQGDCKLEKYNWKEAFSFKKSYKNFIVSKNIIVSVFYKDEKILINYHESEYLEEMIDFYKKEKEEEEFKKSRKILNDIKL